MKAVLLAAGSGAMYCGACARDAALARGLISQGHDAVVMPLYTPVRLESGEPPPTRPVLFGGVNAYLREVLPGYGWWSAPVRRLLDSQAVLGWASRFAIRTKAADLGPMTVSVLKGSEGKHGAEFRRVASIVAAERADVVVIANSLLLSLAPALRDEGRFRIVCQVQGEDGFLDELPEPWRSQALELMRGYAAQVDRFLSPSKGYATKMAELLGVPIDSFDVLSHPVPNVDELPFPEGPPTLGHLSSIRRAKGLDILLKAMAMLPSDVLLRVGGKALEADFAAEVRRLAGPLGDRVEFLGEIAPSEKPGFFASVDAQVLPSRLVESRGLAAVEALAFGRPVVAPARGVFADLATTTPGVILHRPDDPEDLARALAKVLDRSSARQMGAVGRDAIRREYAPDKIAAKAAALLNPPSD